MLQLHAIAIVPKHGLTGKCVIACNGFLPAPSSSIVAWQFQGWSASLWEAEAEACQGTPSGFGRDCIRYSHG